jgi:hypothetical protein
MQKLWFKSKRSQPLPSEVDQEASTLTTQEPLATQESLQEITPPDHDSKGVFKYFQKSLTNPFKWQISATWLFLTLGVGGVVVVGLFGLQYLIAPETTPDKNIACQSKINGDWQTPFGKVTLQEKNNGLGDDLVSGNYEYANLERGKIVGELKGKLRNNVVSFDWQETPSQQPIQQGKGTLIFGEGCKEFYGSYGTGDSNNNFGNWQGSRILK